MIDKDGYRSNIGMVVINRSGQALWVKRYGQNSWQFPQGGILSGETPEVAMYRELYEELGLTRDKVRILAISSSWLRYNLPKKLVRWDNKPLCIGQKQKWFLLELLEHQTAINLAATDSPEFDAWKWVSFWYPVRQIVAFKREVYRKIMKEFSAFIIKPSRKGHQKPYLIR